MSTIVGGLRLRLIRLSVYNMVNDALDQLGWFDGDRRHATVNVSDGPFDEITYNAVALTYDPIDDEDVEMGSNLQENTWTGYADVYAESDALGLHLAGDIRDILRGKMPSIGCYRPQVVVYDYTMATPPELFICEIEGVVLDKARDSKHPNWYSVRFDLVDAYGDEDD